MNNEKEKEELESLKKFTAYRQSLVDDGAECSPIRDNGSTFSFDVRIRK